MKYNNALRKSTMREELADKYSAREMAKMWSELWTVARVLFIFEIIYWSLGTPFLALTVAIGTLLAVYALNRIA